MTSRTWLVSWHRRSLSDAVIPHKDKGSSVVTNKLGGYGPISSSKGNGNKRS